MISPGHPSQGADPVGDVLDATQTAALVDPCVTFEPILYDAQKDTVETLRQVEAYNNKWAALCPAEAARVRTELLHGVR